MVCTKYTPVNYYETLSYGVIKNTVIAWASTENTFLTGIMLTAESKKNARYNRIKKWPRMNTFNSSKQLSKNITMHGQDLCVI